MKTGDDEKSRKMAALLEAAARERFSDEHRDNVVGGICTSMASFIAGIDSDSRDVAAYLLQRLGSVLRHAPIDELEECAQDGRQYVRPPHGACHDVYCSKPGKHPCHDESCAAREPTKEGGVSNAICGKQKCGEFNMLECVREPGHDGACNYVVDHARDYPWNKKPGAALPREPLPVPGKETP